jgi:hypothetical protein
LNKVVFLRGSLPAINALVEESFDAMNNEDQFLYLAFVVLLMRDEEM